MSAFINAFFVLVHIVEHKADDNGHNVENEIPHYDDAGGCWSLLHSQHLTSTLKSLSNRTTRSITQQVSAQQHIDSTTMNATLLESVQEETDRVGKKSGF